MRATPAASCDRCCVIGPLPVRCRALDQTRDSTTDAAVDRPALQRRTITTLRHGVGAGQAAIAGVVAVLALFVGDLWATIGSRAPAMPVHIRVGVDGSIVRGLQRRRGRRPALVTAFAIGACGARWPRSAVRCGGCGCCSSGWMFFGGSQAASLKADLSQPTLPSRAKPGAIAAVVWLGTLGAVLLVLTPQWKRLAAVGTRPECRPDCIRSDPIPRRGGHHLGPTAARSSGGHRRN